MRRASWLPATILALGLGAGSALAQGANTTMAEPVTTATLASICAATSPNAESPLTAYCRGFMVGAGQYHASVSAATGRRIFCLPEPSPTIESVQGSFVAWARANTQHGQDRAVDGLMRFAAATYPCPAEPATTGTRTRQR
jgi:hypothetical protein